RYLTQPEVVVRFRWNSGDVAFWDNRCTMHYATRDYGNAHRAIRRITLRGDPVAAWSAAEERTGRNYSRHDEQRNRRRLIGPSCAPEARFRRSGGPPGRAQSDDGGARAKSRVQRGLAQQPGGLDRLRAPGPEHHQR